MERVRMGLSSKDSVAVIKEEIVQDCKDSGDFSFYFILTLARTQIFWVSTDEISEIYISILRLVNGLCLNFISSTILFGPLSISSFHAIFGFGKLFFNL